MTNSVLISVKLATKRIGDETIFDGVDFDLSRGEIVALIGRSGVGKSTFLRCLAGLEPITSGEIEWISSEMPAMQWQTPTLQPWLTVEGHLNVAASLRGKNINVGELLDLVGLNDLGGSRISELSGGMQSRLGLARAIAQCSSVLLLDEPFNGLDFVSKRRIYESVATVVERYDLAVVAVTHDLFEAAMIANRIVIMGDSPARIVGLLELNGSLPRREENMATPEMREKLLAIKDAVLEYSS